MSGNQWTILSVAAAVLLVSALFQPWLYKCDWRVVVGLGYVQNYDKA